MRGLKGKNVLVTGGASGIGRGMSETFVEAGMKVVLADVDETRLQATVSTLNNSGAEVLDAIREERLYVITTDDFDDYIKQRMQSIIARKNLVPLEPPKGFMDILQEMTS